MPFFCAMTSYWSFAMLFVIGHIRARLTQTPDPHSAFPTSILARDRCRLTLVYRALPTTGCLQEVGLQISAKSGLRAALPGAATAAAISSSRFLYWLALSRRIFVFTGLRGLLHTEALQKNMRRVQPADFLCAGCVDRRLHARVVRYHLVSMLDTLCVALMPFFWIEGTLTAQMGSRNARLTAAFAPQEDESDSKRGEEGA